MHIYIYRWGLQPTTIHPTQLLPSILHIPQMFPFCFIKLLSLIRIRINSIQASTHLYHKTFIYYLNTPLGCSCFVPRFLLFNSFSN